MNFKLNYIYNLCLTFINLIIPFVTLPYVTKILGPTNYGLVAFSDSILQYFALFSSLGTAIYGAREIGFIKGNKRSEVIIFYDLIIIKISLTLLALLVGFLLIVMLPISNKGVFIAQSILILVTMTDLSWFFQGIGNFKVLAIRGVLVKIVSLILIFIFIKSSNDIVKYILITTVSALVSNLWLLFYLNKYFKGLKYHYDYKRVMTSLKGAFRLFLLQLSIQIYAYFGKTILGFISIKDEVAIFDIGNRLTYVFLSFTSALSSIVMPQISHCISQNDNDLVKYYATKSLVISLFIMIPIFFGINIVIDGFVYWFLGEQYVKVSTVVKIISPVLLIVPIGNVIGVQVLIPMRKEKIVAFSPFIALLFNLIVNMLFTPKFGSYGASFATVITELSGTLFVLFFLRNFFNYLEVYANLKNILFISSMLYLINFLIISFYENEIVYSAYYTIFQVVVFGSVTFLYLFYKKDMFFLNLIKIKL